MGLRYYTNSSEDSEEFVVHRGRNAPTLSQFIRSVSPSSQDERSSPGSRLSNSNSRHQPQVALGDEENGIPPAGRPSSLGAHKTSYAGRRSRRNSFSEADSQLTVENFGGSTEKLNRFVMERNPDKQPAIVTDNTPSPVRYPKRHPQDPSSFDLEGEREQSKERTTSSSDDGIMNEQPPPFYGKTKQGSKKPDPVAVFQPRIVDPYERQEENVTVFVVNDGNRGYG